MDLETVLKKTSDDDRDEESDTEVYGFPKIRPLPKRGPKSFSRYTQSLRNALPFRMESK
uniref:Uncharacterized protein n=1 Tax=Syphacia muris TaxID=451379 RepID=A0A0N5B113_9BILA